MIFKGFQFWILPFFLKGIKDIIAWVGYRALETHGQHVTVQQHSGTHFQNTKETEYSSYVWINYWILYNTILRGKAQETQSIISVRMHLRLKLQMFWKKVGKQIFLKNWKQLLQYC